MLLDSVPGTAATAACAALEEAGAQYELVQVERHNRAVPAGSTQAHPHRRVPTLRDGTVLLDESAAIILWLGDRFPDSPLLPAHASAARADTYRWLTYLTNTVHTAYLRWDTIAGPHIAPDTAAGIREAAAEDLSLAFEYIEGELAEREYLVPDRFTGADLLLHMLVSPNWSMDLAPAPLSRPALAAHHARIDRRPAAARMKQIHGLSS